MDGYHPKRRKDKYNPYRIAKKNGRYFLSFVDGEGVTHNREIDKPLYALFNSFELDDLSYLNEWDRHIEHSELTEASINKRAASASNSVEDTALQNIQNERLHKAMLKLPEIQRRRLALYFFSELTYQRIAEIEGCTIQAIKYSIDAAIRNLEKILKKI